MTASMLSGLLWGMLTLGAILVGGSLMRDTRRFRQWKRLRGEAEGEPVLAQGWLKPGLAATIAFQEAQEPQSATLSEVCKRRVALTPEPGVTLPQTGDSIQVTLTQETGLYRFSTVVREVRADRRRPGTYRVEAASPFWLTHLQRRQHVRTRVQFSADFALSIPGEQGLLLPGTVTDLSGGGFRAELRGAYSARQAEDLLAMLSAGTTLQFRLPVPGLAETTLTAQVRTSERTAVKGGIGIRLCCEFLPMAIWERDLIVGYVFRAQREYLHERAPARPKLRLVQG